MPVPIPSQRSAIIGAFISIVGGLTAIAMLASMRLQGNSLLGGDEVPVVAVALVGAFLAGLVIAPAFGRRGRIGWAIALAGAVATTVVGAFLGGFMLFGSLEDAMICVVMVGSSIVAFPITGLVWVAAMGGAQYLALVLVPKIPANLDLVPGPDNL